MTRKKSIKIGNAGGYWGDDPEALKRQVEGGSLDYITIDFLAEITMSIMQKQRATDPNAGYARDFINILEGVLPKLVANKTKLITNAGGVNPLECARAIYALGVKLGLNLKIAVVHGDDILEQLRTLRSNGCDFKNMEDQRDFGSIEDRVESANIYFGASSVVEALKWNPDLVISGRVTDTGITLAAMIHEFGWPLNDWNKLASGIVAGHIIECGSQSTGGNFTDWHKVKSFSKMGYPIVEVQDDGTFVVTKHPGSGGLVSQDTIREQLVYEMGDPHCYITPDVVADFSSIQLETVGEDRVRIFGVKGSEPTNSYKVSMAYRDGYKIIGSICVSGPKARLKAEAFAKIFWDKAGTTYDHIETEYQGWNSCQRSLGHHTDAPEIMLRLGARDADQKKLKRFSKLVPSLILGGPPGVCVLGGAPKPAEVVSYWPALMPKTAVKPKIALLEGGVVREHRELSGDQIGHYRVNESQYEVATKASESVDKVMSKHGPSALGAVPLLRLALARSGDKGDTANIGLLARSPLAYEWMEKNITAQVVKDLFQELCFGKVIRHKVNNLVGFNFLLESSLGGGGTLTLRTDAQGKTFAQALLNQHFVVPAAVLESVR